MRLLLVALALSFTATVQAQSVGDEFARALLASMGSRGAQVSPTVLEGGGAVAAALPDEARVLGSFQTENSRGREVVVLAALAETRDALASRYRSDAPAGWVVQRVRENERSELTTVEVCAVGGGREVQMRASRRTEGGSYVLARTTSIDCETGQIAADEHVGIPPPPPPMLAAPRTELSVPDGVEVASRTDARGAPTVFDLRGRVSADALLDHLGAAFEADGWVQASRVVADEISVATWTWQRGGAHAVATATVRPDSSRDTNLTVSVLD